MVGVVPLLKDVVLKHAKVENQPQPELVRDFEVGLGQGDALDVGVPRVLDGLVVVDVLYEVVFRD